MACSAVTLSVATIGAVVAVSCLAIAFGTDNWYEIRIKREELEKELDGNAILQEMFQSDIRFFDRDEGIFRICFPNEKPKKVPLYVSPVQTSCLNMNYYLSEGSTANQTDDAWWERLHMARSVVGLFISSFFFIFISFFTGIAGCWKRSRGNVVATGLLLLLAALVDAGAMGLWHGVQYYDSKVLKTGDTSYENWPKELKGMTDFYYGWSYILAWIGVGMSLLTGILFLCAARCLRQEKKVEQAKNMQYLMPVYPDKRQPYGYSYAHPYYPPGTQYGSYGY